MRDILTIEEQKYVRATAEAEGASLELAEGVELAPFPAPASDAALQRNLAADAGESIFPHGAGGSAVSLVGEGDCCVQLWCGQCE